MSSGFIGIDGSPEIGGALAYIRNREGSEAYLRTIQVVGDPDRSRSVSSRDALASIIAETALQLRLNFDAAADLVTPLTDVLGRGLRCPEDQRAADEPLEGTLFRVWEVLLSTSGPSSIVLNGLRLGDMGLHVAAGWGASILHRSMKTDEATQYASAMSLRGYAAAFKAASEGTERRIHADLASRLECLMVHFAPARLIMEGIRRRSTKPPRDPLLISGDFSA